MSSFFTLGAQEKLKENKLLKLEALINWEAMRKVLRGIHRNDNDASIGGQKPYDHVKMLKTILLKEWHILSDKEMEEALRVRLDFILFTGFDLGEESPDESTICRFRNALSAKGIDKVVFADINSQLESAGVKVKESKGAVIDATIIASSARPRRVTTIEMDREEESGKLSVDVQESADRDGRWLKKDKRNYFGYKGFAVVDSDDGYITSLHVQSANVSEVTELPTIVKSIHKTRVYADKGYASVGNRNFLKENGFNDGIMHKAARNKPLNARQKAVNKFISKRRFIVEQCFGTIKRIFNFSRASYFTREKVETQFWLKATCFNLLKAVNKVIIAEKAMVSYA
jgi:transposase, IS5 family